MNAQVLVLKRELASLAYLRTEAELEEFEAQYDITHDDSSDETYNIKRRIKASVKAEYLNAKIVETAEQLEHITS